MNIDLSSPEVRSADPLPWESAQSFREQVVMITGAGRGIGEYLAECFARAGAKVIIVDIIAERAMGVAERLRSQDLLAHAYVVDIADVTELRRMFELSDATHGPMDVFIGSAGFAERRPILEIDETYWDHMHDTNLKGPFFCIKNAALQMTRRSYGRVVMLTSIGGYAAQLHLAAYAASKGGLNLLVKAAASELAINGITVNAVGPGAVEGPWNQQFFSDEEYKRMWMATVPMRRMATNRDVASAVMYLASREAAYVTGQVLYVDGGKLSYVPSVDLIRAAQP